jgi:hypothetical protein
MPYWELPERTLRAAAVVPPMTLPLAPSKTRTPEYAFGAALVPV